MREGEREREKNPLFVAARLSNPWKDQSEIERGTSEKVGGRVDIETVENRGNTDGLTDRHALRYFALVANQLLYGFASRKKSTIHA